MAARTPRRAIKRDGFVRVRRGQDPAQFHPYPLDRKPSQAGDAGAKGVQGGGIGRHPAIAGVEAEEAQDAQVVLGDAGRRVADEAHAAGAQVGQVPSK